MINKTIGNAAVVLNCKFDDPDDIGPIQYDNHGRMKYHPAYHFNHGKEYTLKELSYICQQYRRGNVKNLSMAVGRTEGTLRTLVDNLRKEGKFDFYKNLKD